MSPAHGGLRLVRVCVRARVRGREELGRDGGAEEAGEQVQGAGRQAAAGSGSRSRTPDSHSASRFCAPAVARRKWAWFRGVWLLNVSRGCRQDVAERLLSILGVSRFSCSWISGFQREFANLVPRGSASHGGRSFGAKSWFFRMHDIFFVFCCILLIWNVNCSLIIIALVWSGRCSSLFINPFLAYICDLKFFRLL